MLLDRTLKIFAVLLICSSAKVSGEDVSRQVPPIYQEKLSALLTPLEEVQRAQSMLDLKDENGVFLLDEKINYIEADGRRYLVLHAISKSLNDSGAKYNGEDHWTYRKANQKIHLVLARTILPDGKEIPVSPNAAILQSPQRQADNSLYDDQGELRLIFSNVKPGAITESIVIIEEREYRIPGEFTAAAEWAGGWPVQKKHYVFEMPEKLAQRLKITALGEGVPEPQKQTPEKDRVRWTWTKENCAPLPHEGNQPPLFQTGPVVWLTTLPDWDAFMRWYAPLVEDHAQLKPELAKQVDEWTKDAKNAGEVIDVLMTKVARDVRYVGLEFGSSDLQPHDCNTVWESQYGDCKDKANLLCAMLRHKKINACMALVNTENKGIIERRSPDFRQFTHAIVAAELQPGHYTFCDPTVAFAKPGMLSPGDSDRDVLLIRKDTAEWGHTPQQDAGTVHYDFDLKLGADGQISGWMTQNSSGYYAASAAEDFLRLDKDATRERAGDLVRSFFKGAEIIDVTKTAVEKWDGTYQLKTYFIVPAPHQERQEAQSIAFPQASLLFVDPGTQKSRKTPYYLWADTVKVTARFKLADGTAPSELPRPYKLESPALDIVAQWSMQERECLATLTAHTKTNLVPQDQFETLYNALLSVRAWLGKPLALTDAPDKTTAQPENALTLDNFPMMPSGDGQIELVDQRFAANGDSVLRREALQKTIQYFPYDKSTLFKAGIKLALIDWNNEKPQLAEDEIRKLLGTYRKSISREDAAWGDFVLARVLTDLKKPEEAEKMFERLGADQGLPAYRRAWSHYQRARLLETKSRTKAIQVIRQSLALETEARPDSFALLAKLLILDGHMAELKMEIDTLLAKKPPYYEAMLTQLAESAGNLLPKEKAAERDQLLQILDEVNKANDLGKRFTESLQTAHENVLAVTAASRISSSFKKYLATHPLTKLDAAAAQFKTRADFFRAIDVAQKARKPEVCLRYRMAVLMAFDANADFPNALWRAAEDADWVERFYEKPEPLLPVLLDLCDQLPNENDAYFEGRFLRARVCVRRGEIDAARKIHDELVRNPKVPSAFRITALTRLAGNLETLRAYDKALETYKLMEAEIQFDSAKDGLLRAALLNLEMGRRDEALRIFTVLAGRPPEALDDASTGWQIKECLALIKDKEKAYAYWDASAKWWSAWLKLAEKLGATKTNADPVIAAFPKGDSFDEEIGAAQRSNDRPGYLANLQKIAHGARWEPSLTAEFARLVTFGAPKLWPAAANDLRQFVLSVADDFVTDDPEARQKIQLYAAINALDTDQVPKAVQIIHEFQKVEQPDAEIAESMARLWAIAAQSETAELAPATENLEKLLAAPKKLNDRAKTVLSLGSLYQTANRAADEENLLKREIDQPDTKASGSEFKKLAARYDAVVKAGAESKQFLTAIEAWLQKKKPAWYDFAEPKSLDDPRLSKLETVLKNPQQVFSSPEIIKLQLLVASSPDQPVERRGEQFVKALLSLLDLTETHAEARDLVEPLIDDNQYPESVRFGTLWLALVNAKVENDAAHFEKLMKHPLYERFNEETKTACTLFKEVLAVDINSPEAIRGGCEKLLQKELSASALQEFRHFYNRLLECQQLDIAEAIYKRLGEAKLDPTTKASKTALQMECLKSLSRARKSAPLIKAMRELVFGTFPADQIQKPAVYSSLQNLNRLNLDEETAANVRLYQIKSQQFSPINFSFWAAFVRGLPPTEANKKLTFDLIDAALQNAPDDNERLTAFTFATAITDFDDTAVRAELARLWKQYRNPEKFPLMYASIRLYEIRTAWRSGQKVDLQGELSNLKLPLETDYINRLKLSQQVQARDLPLLRKSIETWNPDELLADRNLDLSLKAFELLGMTDELNLAKDAARKSIYQSVLAGWAMLDNSSLMHAYSLASALDDPSGIPESCFKDVAPKIKHPRYNAYLCAADAQLRKDWPRLLAASDKAIPQWPTFYHFYWQKGSALYHLGKTKEAVEPLRTYVQYSKDESEYPEANEWLKKLVPMAAPEQPQK